MPAFVLAALFILNSLNLPLLQSQSPLAPATQGELEVSDPFLRYLVDYEYHAEPEALWLLYLMASSNELLHNTLRVLVEEQPAQYPVFRGMTECMDFDSADLLLEFVRCSESPDLMIAYLYEYSGSDSPFPPEYIRSRPAFSEIHQQHLDYMEGDANVFDNFLHPSSFHFLFFHMLNHSPDRVLETVERIPFQEWTNGLNSHAKPHKAAHLAYRKTLLNLFFKAHQEDLISEIYRESDYLFHFPVSMAGLTLYRYLSFSLYHTGYYHHDLKLQRDRMLPLSASLSLETELQLRMEHAVSLHEIGNTPASMKELEYVYAYRSSLPDLFMSMLYNNLGVAYYHMGRFDDYLALLIDALEYARATGNTTLESKYLYNLFLYYGFTMHPLSEVFLQEILTFADSVEEGSHLIEIYSLIGRHHTENKNDPETGRPFFYKALKIAERIRDYENLQSSHRNISHNYYLSDDWERAIYHADQGLQLSLERNVESGIQHFSARMAELLIITGDLEAAARYIRILEKGNIDAVYRHTHTIKYYNLAVYAYLKGEEERALELLSEHFPDALNRLASSSDLFTGSGYELYNIRKFIEFFFQLLLEHGRTEELIAHMDALKNLSYAAFYQNAALKTSILTEDELILDYVLKNRISRLRLEIARAEGSEKIQLNNQLLQATARQNALMRKVLSNIDITPADLPGIQRRLGRSEVIVYFTLVNDLLIATAITNRSIRIVPVRFTEEEKERTGRLIGYLSSSYPPLTELEWLRQLVLDPLEISEQYTHYYVVPDGFLYYIPLEILPVDGVDSDFSYGQATYLIEKASVIYLNSLKDLERSKSPERRAGFSYDFLGYGVSNFEQPYYTTVSGLQELVSLPLAEVEVEKIASILTGLSRRHFLQSTASTARHFREHAGSSRILHLASHSEIHSNDPLYSVLYLKPATDSEQSEGDTEVARAYLYAYELFDMGLQNEMIMLNSCESASGSFIPGSGILGFSRAFNYAGVQSLVLNQWSIRDHSAYELSLSFYSYLNQGYSKSRAMRQAKIDYMNRINSNPSHWGSFVLFGNDDPMVRPYRKQRIMGLSVLLFLLAGFVIRKKIYGSA